MANDNFEAGALDIADNDLVTEEESGIGADTSSGIEQHSDASVVEGMLNVVGIPDPSRIKFEEPNGQITERQWKDLSEDEKKWVISAIPSERKESDDLTQSEVDLINRVRTSGTTPEGYIDNIRSQAVQSVATPPSYQIDNLSDDELFLLDAIDRYGEEDVTDDQLERLLENAKGDPELYEKTISSLRNIYKAKEDEIVFKIQQAEQKKQQQEIGQFNNQILDEIESFSKFGNSEIQLSTDDMNDLANFILTRDENGVTDFGKILNDPKMFTQMAFWALKGKDMINEMNNQIRTAYARGLAAGKGGQSSVAFSNRSKNGTKSSTSRTTRSADTLDVI